MQLSTLTLLHICHTNKYNTPNRNCEKFHELYGNIPRVKTPAIYWEATGRRVLTMEFIEGIKLTDVEGMKEAGLTVIDFVDVSRRKATQTDMLFVCMCSIKTKTGLSSFPNALCLSVCQLLQTNLMH